MRQRSTGGGSWRRAVAAAAIALVAACSSHRHKVKPEKPMPLAEIKTRLDVKRDWQTKLSGDAPKLQLGLGASVLSEVVVQAGASGQVRAQELATGHTRWQVDLKQELSGGPGIGEGLVLVGSANGFLIALSEQTGQEVWRVELAAEMLSTPVAGHGLVVARTLDGKLYGLSARDGTRRWVVEQTVPSLTLRGIATPVINGEQVYAGFDNGRLLAVALNGGAILWDVPVSQARGSTALQRMVDIDSPAVIDGGDVFVVGYQGKLARISREGGQVLWAREVSSYRGLAVDQEAVYVSTAAGEVLKFDRRSGAEVWKQRGLLRRKLSAPALLGGHVVVADYAGVVHWLDAADGSFMARSNAGGPVAAPPLVAGDELLVAGDDGSLSAFSLTAATAMNH